VVDRHYLEDCQVWKMANKKEQSSGGHSVNVDYWSKKRNCRKPRNVGASTTLPLSVHRLLAITFCFFKLKRGHWQFWRRRHHISAFMSGGAEAQTFRRVVLRSFWGQHCDNRTPRLIIRPKLRAQKRVSTNPVGNPLRAPQRQKSAVNAEQ